MPYDLNIVTRNIRRYFWDIWIQVPLVLWDLVNVVRKGWMQKKGISGAQPMPIWGYRAILLDVATSQTDSDNLTWWTWVSLGHLNTRTHLSSLMEVTNDVEEGRKIREATIAQSRVFSNQLWFSKKGTGKMETWGFRRLPGRGGKPRWNYASRGGFGTVHYNQHKIRITIGLEMQGLLEN